MIPDEKNPFDSIFPEPNDELSPAPEEAPAESAVPGDEPAAELVAEPGDETPPSPELPPAESAVPGDEPAAELVAEPGEETSLAPEETPAESAAPDDEPAAELVVEPGEETSLVPETTPAESAVSGDEPAVGMAEEDTLLLARDEAATRGPDAPTPPRIVAETPIGAKVQPAPRVILPPAAPAPLEPAPVEPPADEPRVRPLDPEASTVPGTIRVSDIFATDEEAGVETPAPVVEPSRVRMTETPPAPAKPDEWQEDDLSPELAAILFTPGKQKESVSPADTAAPPVEIEEPAEPITLTDAADVRRLRLTAEGRSAPAPDAPLAGKVRYVRVEEPLKDDAGQRTTESWEYIKPNYPALEGRLVRRVEIEEITYSDGSWNWQYERHYDDKGRDRRSVQANTDRTYIERTDEISKKDADSDKLVRLKEEVALIFAPPLKEEKGGFLSRLFGGDDTEYADGPKAWRPATSAEAKQARKQGGAAF